MASSPSLATYALTLFDNLLPAGGCAWLNYPFLTSKERDNETGLDYSVNRYYSNAQGRFTSVDPQNAGGDSSYPQSWNGYTYVRNNPLLYVDPEGLDIRVYWNRQGGKWYGEREFQRFKRDLESQGFIVKGGKIFSRVFDDDGNAIGVRQIGTYASDMNEFGQGVAAELAGRNPYFQRFGQVGLLYMSFFTTPITGGAPMVGWLGRGLATTEVAAPVGAAAATSLIQAAGQLTPLAKGGVQGWVRGNAQQLFQAITKGATKLPSGAFKLADGTRVSLYNSSNSGVATIHIHTAQQIFSIRILP